MFPKDATEGIHACRPRRHPLIANAVQRDDLLLSDRFHMHRGNRAGAHRIQEGVDVGPIRLVAAQVRFHLPDGQQGHAMPVTLRDAAPMMGSATGFHHDVTRRLVRQKAPELLSIEPPPFDQPPLPIGDSHFKYRH